MEKKFLILGIHPLLDEANNIVKEYDSARVRMYVGDKEFDEDFALPELPPGVPPTQEVFEFYLKENILKRMEELK
jgi:hypothetical protein